MVKKVWAGVLFVFALLVGLFLRERKGKIEAESQVANAEYNTSSAVTKEQLANLDRQTKAAIAIAEVEKGRKLSDEELLEFLKNV